MRTITTNSAWDMTTHLSTWTDRSGIRYWRAMNLGAPLGAMTTDKEAAIRDYYPAMLRERVVAPGDWRAVTQVWHGDLHGCVLLRDIEAPNPDLGYLRVRDSQKLPDIVIPQTALADPFCLCGDLLARCPRTTRDCSEPA